MQPDTPKKKQPVDRKREAKTLKPRGCATMHYWVNGVCSRCGAKEPNGQTAVEFLCKRGEFATAPTPDLIFLDVHLPNLTGVEVLRSVPSPEKLPLCVLTSSRADEEVFKREFGIAGLRYLIKPVTPKSLLDCLRSINHFEDLAPGKLTPRQ